MNQTEVWTSRKDGEIRLSDMDDEHVLNLIAWMRRNRNALRRSASACLTASVMIGAPDDVMADWEREVDDDRRTSDEDWLDRQPLMCELMRMARLDLKSRLRKGSDDEPASVGGAQHSVFIIEGCDDDDQSVYGVFSTRKRAKRVMRARFAPYVRVEVTEYPVDPS
jgi:hypothetical protein